MKTLSFCLVLVIGVQRALAAQTFYGIAGGLNYAGPNSGDYTRGFALQASVGRQFGDRFAVRLDAFVNHVTFQQAPAVVAAMCAYGANCGPYEIGGLTAPVGVGALRATEQLIIDPPKDPVRMYFIVGAGAYYFYQHPKIEGAVRPGLSAGAGFTITVRGRSRLFVEGVYDRIAGASNLTRWLLPLTFGIRF